MLGPPASSLSSPFLLLPPGGPRCPITGEDSSSEWGANAAGTLAVPGGPAQGTTMLRGPATTQGLASPNPDGPRAVSSATSLLRDSPLALHRGARGESVNEVGCPTDGELTPMHGRCRQDPASAAAPGLTRTLKSALGGGEELTASLRQHGFG